MKFHGCIILALITHRIQSPKRGGTRQGADRNVVRLKATLATSGREGAVGSGTGRVGNGKSVWE